MTAKYTPGPWRYQKPRGPQHAIDRKFEIVAPLDGGGELIIVGEHTGIDCLKEANARLIAAAPEMAELLRECLTRSCRVHPDPHERVSALLQRIEVTCDT